MNRLFTPTVSPDFPSDAPASEMFADSGMKSRHVRIDATGSEALYRALDLETSFTGSARRDYRSYAEAAARSHRIFSVLQSIASELGCHLVEPPFPAISPAGPDERRADSMKQTGLNWCEGLVKQMATNRIGRLELLGDDAVRFTFFEVDRKRGLWTDNLTRTKFRHELVGAKASPLPADHIYQPPKARRIARLLQSVPELGRSSRIIWGMQVSKAVQPQDQWREDSTFARHAKSTGLFVKNHAAAVGAGLGAAALGTLATLAVLAKSTAVAATAVAVADPAIVLGDIVFYGWD